MAASEPLLAPLRILVVEDEAHAAHLLDHQLRGLGCATLLAASVAAARQCLAANDLDLVLCRLDLPDETGLDLLRWLAARSAPERCPVILVAPRPSVDTAIQALRAGAADYLSLPLTPDELARALQRVTQRLRPPAARPPAASKLPPTAELRPLPATAELPPLPDGRQYQVGPVLLDLDRFIIAVNGRHIDATPSELEILHYLCRHPDRVVTAQEVVQSLRGYPVDPRQAPELIRPHISNLRRKLLAADLEADIVRTVRGVGYMLRLPGT